MKKIIVFCLLFLLNIVSAYATEYETDISVDITANTVSEAKKQAMAKAIRDGLTDVVLSISTEKSVKELQKLTDNQLQHFISGVMVLMEKSSDVRYIADLRISVDEKVLRAYLEENDLPVIESEEQFVLVIPLVEKKDGIFDLWGEDNFWRQAFLERRKLQKGNISIKVIEKNLGNITAVETNRIYNMNDREYNELASFNQIHNIYVLKYSQKDEKVYVKEFPGQAVNEIEIGEDSSDKLINKVLPYLKGHHLEQASVEPYADNVKEKIEAIYSYDQLGSWMGLKKQLDENSQVENLTVISMVNGKVHFSFTFNGMWEKFLANMKTYGYQFRKEGEYYAVY